MMKLNIIGILSRVFRVDKFLNIYKQSIVHTMQRGLMKEGKRAQVSLFIIVGVLIAAIFILFFVFQGTDQTDEARRLAEDVPLEFNPIKVFTEDCLRVTAEQGLIRLGQQGGYIRPKEWYGLRFDSEQPTESDGITFSETTIPYWLYNSAANDANVIQLTTLKPTLEQMQSELKRWIEEEIDYCLDNYRVFQEQQFSVESGELEVVVTIAENSVNVQLVYPLTASREGRFAEMENFYTEIPLQLKHMIDVATLIWEAQRDFSFLEEHTLSVMTLFSGTETDKLPPLTDTTFRLASSVIWQERDVQKMMRELLSSYVSLLQFYNSRNFFPYEVPEGEKFRATKQRIYNNMILPLSGAEDLDVRFTYLDSWEPYIDANANGGIIKPQSMFISTFGIVFGMQQFKTVYDVSYPVWVTLHDPDALGNRGYFFNFALETNVRNNRPVEQDQILPAPVLSARDSLLCDQKHRNSGMVTVIVQDAYTHQPVPEAQVSFVAGEQNCIIGGTDAAGVLSARFPVAVGGVVHVSAADYVGTSQYITTERGKDDMATIEIAGLTEVNLLVQKKKVYKCDKDGCLTVSTGSDPLTVPTGEGWQFSTVPVNLKPAEQALVSLTRISQFDDSFTFATIVNGRNPQRIRIPQGSYKVMMQLILNEEYVIPEREECENLVVSEECYTIPEVKFDTLINGGLELGADDPLVIEDDIYSAQEIRLFAVSPALTDIPLAKRRIENIEQLGKVKEYSDVYSEFLEVEYR